jgi:hypothetical protein
MAVAEMSAWCARSEQLDTNNSKQHCIRTLVIITVDKVETVSPSVCLGLAPVSPSTEDGYVASPLVYLFWEGLREPHWRCVA